MECIVCKNKLTERQIKRKNKTCSRKCAGVLYSKERNVDIKCLNCGDVFTVIKAFKDRKFCSQTCSNIYNFKDKEMSVEQALKISESQTNLNKHKECECDRCGRLFDKWTSLRAHKTHCGKRKEKFTCENCGKVLYGYCSYNAHLQHCEGRFDASCLERGRITQQKKGFKKSDTDIEKILEGKIRKKNIKYKKQYFVQHEGFYHVCDFYLPKYNLIIEADGDYWHKQEEVIKRDKKVNKEILKLGYKLIRLWGSDIKKYPNKCIKEILRYGKNKTDKEFRLSKSL